MGKMVEMVDQCSDLGSLAHCPPPGAAESCGKRMRRSRQRRIYLTAFRYRVAHDRLITSKCADGCPASAFPHAQSQRRCLERRQLAHESMQRPVRASKIPMLGWALPME